MSLVFQLKSAIPPLLTSLILLHAALRGSRGISAFPRSQPWELPPGRFLAVLAGIAMTILLAVIALPLAGFSHWLEGAAWR